MGLEPQLSSPSKGIKTGLRPPRPLVAGAMNLTMMASTERDGELVADLAAECPVLRKAQVMGIRRLATTDQARVLGDKLNVRAVAGAARLRQP